MLSSTMVELVKVSHNFGTNWALKNVSFTLGKGDFCFLTGPSGAGKSTLLRLLYGGVPLKRGKATVAGFDLKDLPHGRLPKLRRAIGVVFQDFKILPERSVFANVALPLEVRGLDRESIGRRVRAVLRALKLDDKAQVASGLLSGGEQQRVAIARAMVINPRLILADEPTGNLDPDLSARIMEIFKQFHAHGTTVLMATHSPEMLRAMPQAKILKLRHGGVEGANFRLPADAALLTEPA